MITFIQVLFVLVAGVTLGSALMVVLSTDLVHSALWLVAALFGVSILFGLLQAGFLAVVQVVIYIGAIAVLFIFAIMLTRRVAQEVRPRFNENWPWAVLIAVVIFAGLTFIVTNWPPFYTLPKPLDPRTDPLRLLGTGLVSPTGFVLPFELASVLLLGAMIGAIFIARDRK
jgi:NADH-quinone oxidoreductase subunit J